MFCSLNIVKVIKSRRMRWTRYVAHMWNKNACNIFVGKSQAKGPLGRNTRWEDNIKIYLT
jgi:hypothetical protein